ncbi:luciferin sulfotransferase-like isoform X2 [Uranotaenia lowii]|uniref:luciferin sulfotransferase-like isoform X2 n=1 Tax=Uranotaenia lowii TaxID=190385 RepID=UPI002479CA35|nr:luciferin sulfotransferase-like isoform X2 [Uranotaenia lowii]
MYNFEKLDTEVVRRIECPGTERHYKVSLAKGFSSDAPNILRNSAEQKFSIMIETYLPLAEKIKKLTVYEDDVWVITFPKCGTTWTQEMVWLLNNELNFKNAKNTPLEERFPFLELTGALTLIGGDSVGDVERLSRPRHIKSHLPAMLLPDQIWQVKPRIIYVARNPKDAATSFFHHYRNIVGYEGRKEHFFDAFLTDSLIYAPFSGHVLDYWRIRDEPNVLFITYEQMKRDLGQVIVTVSSFLGKSFTDTQIDQLTQHLSIDSMRANKACNMDLLVEWARQTNYSKKRQESDGNQFKFILFFFILDLYEMVTLAITKTIWMITTYKSSTNMKQN